MCCAGVADCANKAGALLFLRLVFADEMHGSEGPLIALGAISLVGQAALATQVQRQQAVKQLKRRTSALPRRCRRAAVELASGERNTHFGNSRQKARVVTCTDMQV